MKEQKTYLGTPIYTTCSGCNKVKYGSNIIKEKTLKAILGDQKYYLSHTFLSKQCLNKYIESETIKQLLPGIVVFSGKIIFV